MRLSIALLFVSLLVAGCTSTPEASRERDADAKQFYTHPNAATIYVYRLPSDQRAQGQEQSVLYLDDRLIGQTLPGAYFRIDAVPGRHLLHGIGSDMGRLQLDTRPGELYFVELTVPTGNSQFRLVRGDIARKHIVQCCALLENWAPGQRPLIR